MSALAQAGLVLASAAVLTALATRFVLHTLLGRQILDIPNERSSHSRPVPRGSGLGLMLALLPLLAAIALTTTDWRAAWFVPGLVLLLAISWIDDRRPQSAPLRLACHGVAVIVALNGLPADALVLQGTVPLLVDRALAAIGWIWFINLTNFMDGIDGITGVETASIGLGIVAVAAAAMLRDTALPLYGAAIAGAGLGFLVWNWHPARVFLGDVGSVPLGFLCGGLLIVLAAGGAFAAAIIIPAYYLADATMTLLWRLRHGERLMQAHRHHWYQKAADRVGHAKTTLAVALSNGALMAAAVLSLAMPLLASMLALVMVALVLAWMSGLHKQRKADP